ncbi:MAG TPA: endonuclease/exonuclease/phosphatase family protein [Candidatus Corynebacterium avicola]|uniref:Endonuclease/exonuclease/phosphatase family protein n=1 Tax=Candidatus Corynebacterium avicola TaxID=2838527 RepID=A0A9D1RMB5_9CORY|nr:endonuclease/exonuclease/phosphatase family protein [Candidatus Corynebacterium avicola]
MTAISPRARRVLRRCGWVLLILFLLWASTPLWPLTAVLPGIVAWLLPAAQAVYFLGVIAAGCCAVALVWGGTRRRTRGRRVGVATVVLCTLLGLTAADMAEAVRTQGAEAAAGDSSLRIMSLNTYYGAAEDEGIVDAVDELRPDVLVLAETSTEEVSAVEDATGLRAVSPVLRRTPGAGTAILVDDGKASEVSEDTGITRHQMPVAELAESQATVAGVHTNTPVHRDLLGGWLQEMEDLRDWAGGQDGPAILAGDFNAALSHPEFRELVFDADLERCAGSAMGPATWPAAFPAVRLDHILVAGASCGDSGALRVDGSDHRAIWADVQF